MKAAVFHAQEDLRIEEVADPSPGPGQVKLRNAFAGICGSDLHVYYTPEAAGLDFEHPHPLTGSTLPQILGHEFSGTVVELGEGVDGISVGDRVAIWPIYYCGDCAACRRGMYNACQKIGFHGLSSDGGGMAEFTTVDASKLHVLPENVDLRLGALVRRHGEGGGGAQLPVDELGDLFCRNLSEEILVQHARPLPRRGVGLALQDVDDPRHPLPDRGVGDVDGCRGARARLRRGARAGGERRDGDE